MTHTELNALPHRTIADLDAIPSVMLTMISGPKDFLGMQMRVFDAEATEQGWTGCVRMPRTGDFYPRKLYSRENYSL